MKVTNGDLWLAAEPLKRLMQQQSIPLRYGLEVARRARKMIGEIAIIDEARNKLVLKYGTTSEEGETSITPQSENWANFAKEFEELMALPCEIETSIRLPAETTIPLEDLAALAPFIEIEE